MASSAAATSSRASIPMVSPKSFAQFQGLRAVAVPATPCRVCARKLRVQRTTVQAVALPLWTFEGSTSGEVELNLRSARPETAKAVVHRAVVTEMQNRRSGTASTLTRSEVRGGGKKPYKQKGTGNARIGSRRTPLKPGGGAVFGPKPRDWSIKINRREKQLAIGTAFQNAASSMIVVREFNDKFEAPRTRDFVAALSRWGVDSKKDKVTLFATELSPNAILSARNIPTLTIITPRTLNVYDILRADKIVVTESGLEYLHALYGEEEFEEEEFEAEVAA